MGRRKIEIKYINDDRNRSVTFIKRKNGLFKKAHELSILTGAKVTVHVEDIKERHFDYKSANAGGAAADEAFDSDEEDEEDEGEDVAMGHQQTQQKMGQHQFMGVMQGVSMDTESSPQQQTPQQQIQARPLQAIAAQPARPGHRRTQSSTLHLSPNQPNSAISKARPNGHPYPRSPKVPSTPTMTASSASTQQLPAHRPQSLEFTAYSGIHSVPAGLSTPNSAATSGNHAHHAHRLSSASTVSQIDLAQAMGTPQTASQATFNSNGQQVYYGRSPGLSEFDAVFPQDPPRPPIQQPRFPQGYQQQQQGNGHNAKLEDFEGFEYMEEDADPSMTQASTPALYDYSANPSLTNLHAPPTGSGANAPGLGIVLEAGFDGYSPTTSEQQFHANRQQQQQLIMQQQAQMQGRAMHSAQMQQPYQNYRPSPGFDPHQQGSFYSNASGAMSTPNLSWFGSAR